MKNFCSALALLASASMAQASTQVINCSAEVDGKDEKISLKVNDQGEIQFWAKNKMAQVAAGSQWLTVFKEDTQKYGFDYTHTKKSSSGDMLLEAGDTGGAFQFNLKADRKSAKFSYTDHGSGAGDKTFDLSCEASKDEAAAPAPIMSCKLPVNADLGIKKEVPVSLLTDGASAFKALIGQPPKEFKGLSKISITDSQAIDLAIGYFREALYVSDTSKIKSAEFYSSAEGSEHEVKVFKFLDHRGSLVIWAALVDGIGSGCK